MLDGQSKPRLGSLLVDAQEAWRAALGEALAKRSAPPLGAGAELLAQLSLAGISQSLLAERMGLTKQAVQQSLDHLEKLGLIRREPDPVDRRAKYVVLTEQGLFELTARGVDLVIAEQYPGHTRAHVDGLEREMLGTDPIRLAVGPANPARSLDDRRSRAWAMEPAGTAARQWAVQQCRAAGFEPDVRFELADLTAQARLVATGHAVAVLPDLLWAGAPAPVRLLDLPGRPTREVFTAQRAASRDRAGIVEVRRALRDAFAVTGRGPDL